MAATRSSFRALLTGLVLATVALLFGAAATAGAAPYPPRAGDANGSLWIDGDTVRACGAAGSADAGTPLVLTIDGQTVATGASEADGSFCISAPIPAGLASGLHQAALDSVKRGAPFTLTANFVVPAAGGPAAPAAQSLPRTGTDSGSLARLAVVLMAAGTGMVGVVALRRRQGAAA